MHKIILATAFALMTTVAFGQKVSKVKGDDFGAGISSKEYVEYADMMNQLDNTDTVQVTVKAKVSNVCQAKGCWMTLDGADPEMMVKFKDYGFFVPKDIGGSDVILEGMAYSTTIPVDELRHYAEDAGKSAEEIAKITEPETKYAFLATGVRVVR